MTSRVDFLRLGEFERTNSVGHADSVEKILGQISMLSPDEVTYVTRTGRTISLGAHVESVVVTPSLFRRFICTPGCTACCQKFTLDYTPSEYETVVQHQEGFERRDIVVNGKKKYVYTNDQNKNPICDFLRVERPDGGLGCAQYPSPPLSCLSAPQLQFIQMRPTHTYVLKKPFGRAWAMTPTPQCQFVEFENTEEMRAELEMMHGLLERFMEWARYMGIKTVIPQVWMKMSEISRAGIIPSTGIKAWERV